MANANMKRRSDRFYEAGYVERRCMKLDPDTDAELVEYARARRLPMAHALADLVELGLETLRQDRLRGLAEIVTLRNQRRIAAVTRGGSNVGDFDFESHCFGCGARGSIRRVSGHEQCVKCGCVVKTCCDI